MKRVFTIIFLVLLSTTLAKGLPRNLKHERSLFPRSKLINLQVYFWKQIFTTVSTKEGLLHDHTLILPIYRKVSLTGLSRTQALRKIKKEKLLLQKELKSLADKIEKQQPLNREEKRILGLFYQGISPTNIRKAVKRLRFQHGLADRFKQGMIRAGAYLPYIYETLEEYQLPLALSNIPHVESSFNLIALSKTGAKGIWQFTEATGREFMTVDEHLDERQDAFISTVAAAKLLQQNYEMLQSWPLAITAYNHGANGIRRITEKMKNRDLSYLIRHYKSSRFSFASKNFYAEFLAAWDVVEEFEKYFGATQFSPPIRFQVVQLPEPVYLNTVSHFLPFSSKEIVALNPAFKNGILSGLQQIPSDYLLKVPINFSMEKKEISTPKKKVLSASTARWITVRKGDTLASISQSVQVPLKKLITLNGLSLEKAIIYPGQQLQIAGESANELPQNKTSTQEVVSNSIPTDQQKANLPSRMQSVTVRGGDTLFSIARKLQVPVKKLAKLNNLSLEKAIIYPGQQLQVPSKTSVTIPTIERETRIKQKTLPSTSTAQWITVRRGDTLFSIARKLQVSVKKLATLNDLSLEKAIIYPGQQLQISQ